MARIRHKYHLIVSGNFSQNPDYFKQSNDATADFEGIESGHFWQRYSHPLLLLWVALRG